MSVTSGRSRVTSRFSPLGEGWAEVFHSRPSCLYTGPVTGSGLKTELSHGPRTNRSVWTCFFLTSAVLLVPSVIEAILVTLVQPTSRRADPDPVNTKSVAVTSAPREVGRSA